ncbi:single-stranded DNA-binding protein [Morganella morganii]|uniref:single-stranded DNA-binding protein n=1 Tax=Morganella morganii TaxID=582 RepID=UPI001BD9795E|nr:single-stranded DNA-binding protein [Morganella morganii]ELA8731628.1 single-stranded DNA-binding protein [Morganella morganii]ELB1849388.1 single-stranded DNA-binding protein [Morganella morganii]MBT0490825.1 single-stranded DNA-binding protein [Morganella morganii subsp. morganii]MBT0493451.1 single-stranded DNA-binding protein [Morganella morganii subsp. morganii]QWL94738.1 single-stranded DNA-binding protein [Morganella morganii subsp. morganii]
MAINVITVSGNIGKDCVQRWTPEGKAVASFSLPVKQGYGEHEKTTWVICKMFGAKAEKLPEHLKKGMKVTVTGEFITEEWTGQDGNKRSAPVIIVNQLDFSGNQAGSQKQQQRTQQPPAQNDPPMDFDDDIPF